MTLTTNQIKTQILALKQYWEDPVLDSPNTSIDTFAFLQIALKQLHPELTKTFKEFSKKEKLNYLNEIIEHL